MIALRRRSVVFTLFVSLILSLMSAITMPAPKAYACDPYIDTGCVTSYLTDNTAPAECTGGCRPITTFSSNPEVNWGVATWTLAFASPRTGRPLPNGLPPDNAAAYVIYPERMAYGVYNTRNGYEWYRTYREPYMPYTQRSAQSAQPCRLGPSKDIPDPENPGATRSVLPDGVYWRDSRPWGDYTQNVNWSQNIVIGTNMSGSVPSPEVHDFNAQPWNRKRDITYYAQAIYRTEYWYTIPGYTASYTDPVTGAVSTWYVPPQDVYHQVFDHYDIHQVTTYTANPTYPYGMKAYTWGSYGQYYRDTTIYGRSRDMLPNETGTCRYPVATTKKKECIMAIGYVPALGLGVATLTGPTGKGLPGLQSIQNGTPIYDPLTQSKTITILNSSGQPAGAYSTIGKYVYQNAPITGDPSTSSGGPIAESTLVAAVKACGKAILPVNNNPKYQGNYRIQAPAKRSVCTWVEYTSSFIGWSATDFYKCKMPAYDKPLDAWITRYCDGTIKNMTSPDLTTDFYSANCPVTSYTCSTSLGTGYTVTASSPAPTGTANRNMPARATSPDGRKFFTQPLPVLQLLANGKQWKVDWGMPNLTVNSGYTNPRDPYQSFILAKDSTPADPTKLANDASQPVQATINGVRTLSWGPPPGTTGFINPWINTTTTPMMVWAMKPGNTTSTNEKGVKGFSISMVWGRTYDKKVTVGEIGLTGLTETTVGSVKTYTEPAVLACEANVFSGKAVTVRNSPAINK